MVITEFPSVEEGVSARNPLGDEQIGQRTKINAGVQKRAGVKLKSAARRGVWGCGQNPIQPKRVS